MYFNLRRFRFTSLVLKKITDVSQRIIVHEKFLNNLKKTNTNVEITLSSHLRKKKKILFCITGGNKAVFTYPPFVYMRTTKS